jgi:hypothetical protein
LGRMLDAFIVDKSHPNGDELHVITTSGYIMIFNEKSERFITVLHARPMQLKRYYMSLHEQIPDTILVLCDQNLSLNQELNLNNK